MQRRCDVADLSRISGRFMPHRPEEPVLGVRFVQHRLFTAVRGAKAFCGAGMGGRTRAGETVSAVVEENVAATEQMAANSSEVSQAIENIASVSQENSAAVEEVSASAEEMSAQVEEVSAAAQALNEMARALDAVVAQFKL